MEGYCGFPGLPKNGSVRIDVNETHQSALYSCLSWMYFIEGNINRTCNDKGLWSGSIPRCGNFHIENFPENFGFNQRKIRTSFF